MSEAPALFQATLDVRWGDMDAYGHVNNARYASYVEETRLRWFASFEGAWRTGEYEPVIAAQTINYRRAVEWPARIEVALRLERRGGSSLTLGFRITADGDPTRLYADGSSVLVWTDPRTRRSTPLPADVLRALPRET
jgi:acyl-CoA thioester hydrolase